MPHYTVHVAVIVRILPHFQPGSADIALHTADMQQLPNRLPEHYL
jgi:hypothetical protein